MFYFFKGTLLNISSNKQMTCAISFAATANFDHFFFSRYLQGLKTS